MSCCAVIQARMGSKRFPQKSQYAISGKTVLAHVLEAVLQVLPASDIFVASSIHPDNEAIVDIASAYNIAVYRGDETKVVSRFVNILNHNQYEYFIRLSGDSPLLDYRVLQESINLLQYKESRGEIVDIVSSAVDRGYPSGTNVELVKVETLLHEYPKFYAPQHDSEFALSYFYENKEQFIILSLPAIIDNPSAYKFAFDTPEDLVIIEKIFAQMDKPHYEYTLQEKCAMYDKAIGRV
jgi:spore coat polysaccharide biosynthesis protein SpsF